MTVSLRVAKGAVIYFDFKAAFPSLAHAMLWDVLLVSGVDASFVAALKTATLALKHRSEKKLRQRVVMFVGSPIDAEPKELEKTGKALKKNGVAVDIISFGDAESNNEKLEALINGVNKEKAPHPKANIEAKMAEFERCDRDPKGSHARQTEVS